MVAAFFYKEELERIVQNIQAYSNVSTRISLMQGISDALRNYSENFKENPLTKTTYDLCMDVSNFIRVFPLLSFQYFSNEFILKCEGNDIKNCMYYINVNPDYAEAKAINIPGATNYRLTPPIL